MADVRELIQYLKDDNAAVRAGAFRIIENMGTPVMPLLVEALDDKDLHIRDYAVMLLGTLGDFSVVPDIVQKLELDMISQHIAFEALGNIIGRYPERVWDRIVRRLVRYFKDDWITDGYLFNAIEKIGKAAVPALIDALEHEDPQVRKGTAQALGKIGDARAVRPLIGALKDKDWDVRGEAALALTKIGEPAVIPLIDALKDKDSQVREGAAAALGEMGDVRALVPLIAGLKDENGNVQRRVTEALGKILDKCKTIESLEAYEKQLDEGLERLQKRFWRHDDLVGIGFKIAKWKKQIAAKKNGLASQRDLILEDIPKPPPRKKGRMYQTMRRATHGR